MTVYLNGEYLPESEARVSVLDRGFLFGDGVYEVVPVYGGRCLRLEEHLDRLERSLAAVRIEPPLDRAGWRDMLTRLLEHNPGEDRSVYLQVTRGVARRDHAFPADTSPTVFAMVNALTPPDPAVRETGVAAVTMPDTRWSRCDIKAITLLANILARQQAVEAGATEAILMRGGRATEGAASNLFVVGDGVIVTPPKDQSLLPGITRDLVVELAADHGIPLMEAPVTEADLRAAEEIWLTSSTKEILPVTRLDGVPVGDGRPGPVWARMMKHYQTYKQQLREGRV
ncbi:D-amino acid aminotransferase [Thioalkalivibrio denitrificans]|uniref:Aminodeoxychorismate lyase n=1 Tax=Thioalkalivibrio denitrificans TaxID=108003 RepID=A0A1V3NJ18_9GAMM|nr:D-amino acid aminotransferase [Thioalkalivibrio denitrificans]OOG24756.1 D-amino acid aminotransferase [Thioalkalivibrio denitrificans]